MAWATRDDARAHWADAQSLDDAVLDQILAAAHPSVVAFAPRLRDRVLVDAVTTSGSPVINCPTGAFMDRDVGRTVEGAGIPAGTVIDHVSDDTTATLSAEATASGSAALTVKGIPASFVMGEVLQAREVAAAAQRGEQDVIGVGDYAIRARPLTAAVKQLLRPRKGIGAVG